MSILTDELKGQIQALSIGGMLQKHIARELEISVHLVRKTEREFGLVRHSMAPLSEETEAKVLNLLRRGHGTPFISKMLNQPQHRIEAVRKAHGFKHAPGVSGHRYHLSVEKKRAIRRRFRVFEKRIANEFGVSETWVANCLRRRRK